MTSCILIACFFLYLLSNFFDKLQTSFSPRAKGFNLKVVILSWIYFFAGIYSVGLSCHDIQATQGATKSGVYLIHPPNIAQGPWKVYCDLQTEGGGWMVFQVRDDVLPKENFMRSWEDYKVGFGDFDREFWLGKFCPTHGAIIFIVISGKAGKAVALPKFSDTLTLSQLGGGADYAQPLALPHLKCFVITPLIIILYRQMYIV